MADPLTEPGSTGTKAEGVAAMPMARAGNPFFDVLNDLSISRQVLFLVGLAASVAIGFGIVLWSQEPDFQPIYGSLEGYDAAQVLNVLETSDIRYKVEPKSGAILVPAEHVAEARLKLAASGIKSDSTVGLEVLDREQELGTSQFLENARYRRGLEGELARTIASMRAVKSARVHLAIPRRTVFVRDRRKPSASVFLDLHPMRELKLDQVNAIRNLVASSVPDMAAIDVTVVDQLGTLLSVEETKDETELKIANQQLAYTVRVEEKLTQRVHNILEPILGKNNYQAEVSTDIDFNNIEQAVEQFNPDAPAVRSEQLLDEVQGAKSAASGVPGALSNQPPGEVTVPEQVGAENQATDAENAAKAVNSRSKKTRNYELDKTVSYTRFQQGQIRRLTVAVVVNDRATVNPDSGEVTHSPWGQADLDRFSQLVKDAVGFDVTRGDSVNVVNASFVPTPEEVIPPVNFWTEPWFWEVVKQVLAGIFIIVLLFGVIRPMVTSLFGKKKDKDDELVALGGPEGGAFGELSDAEISQEQVSLSGGGSMLLPGPHEGYEQQLNAVKGLVAEDPGRVAQVIKQWITEDG
ncbi:flagellar basal-body MS-ring/collar protein FliF [Zooshikella ganghwensis]|uniref:Flagellar M-ring protein n=1 Tax=Zooshikella ganghwensis TaxID=202772 RepID=A0A4P9VMG4_9GAMM|nr:flagellar basal-body MS-ring/collar protein FliF [Zooshikella ganghwensis]RDH43574.1 flagellar basal body M-ring protein FliF [Zooshikella ganghwensis]